jgi:S-adenosylmethionine/arginine decarboxylase-like enzyme
MTEPVPRAAHLAGARALSARPHAQYSGVVPASYVHVLADFLGVPAAKLRDPALVGGLLVAAAGAAGLPALGAPVMRTLPHDGVAGLFLLEGCHVAVHTFPERELLLLDILVLATSDPQKAVDVFTRRLEAREVRCGRHARG